MFEFLINLDYKLFSLINSEWTASFTDSFFVWITDLHKTPYFKFIAIPLVLGIFIKKFKRVGITYFIFLLLTISVSDFIGAKVKRAFERARPVNNEQLQVIQRSHAGHFSFYSNHASNMFAFAQYVSAFVPPLRLTVFTLATLVAYSRVYNGVHYPTDVFAGALVGLFWGWVMSSAIKKLVLYLEARKSGATT